VCRPHEQKIITQVTNERTDSGKLRTGNVYFASPAMAIVCLLLIYNNDVISVYT